MSNIGHFVSKSCAGELCSVCYHKGMSVPASHKVGEEIPSDEPTVLGMGRHNLTAYVCCPCFRLIVGPAAPCGTVV